MTAVYLKEITNTFFSILHLNVSHLSVCYIFFLNKGYGLCRVVKCVGEVFGVMLRLFVCHCGPQGC